MKIINTELNHKEIWLNSLIATGSGFFVTLIISVIFGLVGRYSNDNVFLSIKSFLAFISPFVVGIAIGIKQKMSILETIGIGIVGFLVSNSTVKPNYDLKTNNISYIVEKIGIHLNFSIIGDVATAWIASVLLVYLYKTFPIKTSFDIIIIPLVAIIMSLFLILWLAYVTNLFLVWLKFLIHISINSNSILRISLSPIVGFVMGLTLTLPISSASIAYSIHLNYQGASIALAATCGQMITFGTMVLLNTKKIGTTIATSFGTTMVHMQNYTKNWKILIFPCVSSAMCGFLASLLSINFDLENTNNFVLGGMGTSVLYGPIFTFIELGLQNYIVWIYVILIQFTLPIIIGVVAHFVNKKIILYKKGELNLWNNI